MLHSNLSIKIPLHLMQTWKETTNGKIIAN